MMLDANSAVIGAHNALTAFSPKYPWGWLALPFTRCQRNRLPVCGCFDIRVSFDIAGNPVARHGLTTFKADIEGMLEEYTRCNLTTYVRLVLEKTDGSPKDTLRFYRLCSRLERRYDMGDIVFFGGFRKSDGVVIYSFKSGIRDLGNVEGSDVWQFTGSMAADARWYEKLVPWFYARRMNKKNLEKAQSEFKGKICLFDYL